MITTYLKRYYFDARKLRQRAMAELVRSLDHERMIAVTGSMTTESFGYDSWPEFQSKYLAIAAELLNNPEFTRDLPRREVDRVIGIVRTMHAVHLDARVTFSAVKESLRALEELRRPDFQAAVGPEERRSLLSELGEKTSEMFKTPARGITEGADTIAALLRDLGIRRFVTLNYDFELERAMMIEPSEADRANDRGYAPIARFIANGRILDDPHIRHRLTRRLAHGLRVDSDVFDRERPDRLTEFALGSAAIDYHILHLHGRACSPETMIVGTRDYDALYRKTHPSRLPFQEGMRLLFSGNPILFVGIGMSEAEVNTTLQNFVSDNPWRFQAPIFLVWNTTHFSPEAGRREEEMMAARLDWLVRLGIFVIFDTDLQDAKLNDRIIQRRAARAAAARRVAICEAPDPHLRVHRPANAMMINRIRTEAMRAERAGKLLSLSETVSAMASSVDTLRQRTGFVGSRFRDMRTRVELAAQMDGKVRIWCSIGEAADGKLPEIRPEWNLTAWAGPSAARPLVLIAPRGAGKGSLARRIMDAAFDEGVKYRLMVNAGFCYDTDSLSDAVVRFMRETQLTQGDEPLRKRMRISRERMLARPDVLTRGQNALIILNGVERFFSPNGYPLSVEFDQMLRTIVQGRYRGGRIQFVLLGTDRIRPYMEAIGQQQIFQLAVPEPNESRYLAALAKKFAQKVGDPKIGPADQARIRAAKQAPTAPSALRRTTFGAYLDDALLTRTGLDSQVCLDLLRTMAFIGAPVEPIVLMHAPTVRARLLERAATRVAAAPDTGSPDAEARLLEPAEKLLLETLATMLDLGLIIRFSSFEDYPPVRRALAKEGAGPNDVPPLWWRYGLHRAIMAELRERNGVPLSQSKRATAFNMSLYVAQPVDNDIPEPAVHDELAHLIDHLSGSYQDVTVEVEELPPETAARAACKIEEQRTGYFPPLEDKLEVLQRLLFPHSVAALRAALSVVRGYYSTTTLLSIDRGARLATLDRDGVLVEHAERLERLLRGYRKMTRLREALFKPVPAGETDEVSEPEEAEGPRRDRLDAIGPEPFYRDEIVWIYNEIGVVRLAQGDLYSARSAFDMAFKVNSEVEFGDRSHNWRRIMLNSVMLEIERGRIDDADRHVADIERTVNERQGTSPEEPSGSRAARIVATFAQPRDRDSLASWEAGRSCLHKDFLHEEILAIGLTRSLKGLIEHLRGHLRTARDCYQDGIRILRRLGEHRAYALFQRYYAQLLRSLGDLEQHRREIDLAVAAAESVRQMDFAYPARMARAEATDAADERQSRPAYLRQLLDAQEYGASTDIYRVRVDAATRLARAKLASGDYEMALDHATDALATAVRFGMSLRKITLRILMGQILIRRGDRRSGTALIDSSIEHADRLGYQRAVALAQRIRASERIAF